MPHSVNAYVSSVMLKVKTLVWILSIRQGKPEVMRGAVHELIRRKVNIILALYQPSVAAIVAAAPSMPVVMIAVDYDPLTFGYIESLARPGKEVTGLYLQQIDLAKKRVELLTQAVPNIHAATVFWDSASEDQWKATSSAAREFGLQLADVQLHDPPYDYEKALAQAPSDCRSVVIFPTSPVFYRDRQHSQNLQFGIKSRRYLAFANGSMQAAYFPMA